VRSRKRVHGFVFGVGLKVGLPTVRMTSPPPDPGPESRPAPPSWRRGSVGSSHVWNEARRAAHRSPGTEPGDDPVGPDQQASLSAARLADIVSNAVSTTVQDLFPDLQEQARLRMDTALRGRIADLIEGVEEPEPGPEPGLEPPEPASSRPQPIPVAPEAIDPILTDRIRRDFDRLGPGVHAMKVLRETAITVILETLKAERGGASASADGPSPELARIHHLERRIAKLTLSIGKTREALAKVASMEDHDGGSPSVYREVQGLTPTDEMFDVKRELMADIFDANMRLRSQLREQRDTRGDGPRHSQVA